MSKKTFCAVVTCHDDIESLKKVVGCLLSQSVKPDEILVYVSGVGVNAEDIGLLYGSTTNFMVSLVDNFNDYGHRKRKEGVNDCSCDYLGFFNSDDEYDKDYVKVMMGEAEKGFGLVHCNYTNKSGEQIISVTQHGSITSGNFIVRSSLAKSTGYNHVVYHSDWLFIKDLLDVDVKVGKVDKVLYKHN